MYTRKRILGLGLSIIFVSFMVWTISGSPQAQSPQVSGVDLQKRIETLEKENQEDYRAIQDLYQRIQNIEQRMIRNESDLNGKIQSLSRENENLRQQLRQSQENDKDRSKRSPTGYPSVRSVRKDRSGNLIIDYNY